MEDSKSKSYAHHVMTMRWRAQMKLESRWDVQLWRQEPDWQNKLENCAHIHFTCQCSCALCGRCSGSWWSRCHRCCESSPRIRNTSVEFFLDVCTGVHNCALTQTTLKTPDARSWMTSWQKQMICFPLRRKSRIQLFSRMTWMRNVSVQQTSAVHVPHERQEPRPHKEFTTACNIHLISKMLQFML